MGNFDLSVVKTSGNLYHRICSKEFFQTLLQDREK